MTTLNVGAHLSLGPKPRTTVEWAAANGFGSLQIFASSPGAWRPPILPPSRTADFVAAREEHGVNPLFIHAIYLINLASSDESLVERSKQSLIATMEAGAAMQATGVITHIGSHAGRGFEAVADVIAGGVAEVLASSPEPLSLILENSAGPGNIVGAEIRELGEIVRRAGAPARLTVALDTAHLCGSGWDFNQQQSAELLLEEVDREFGLERLVVIHANDSAQPPGSRRDRHANIGKGYIGLPGFGNLLRHPALVRIPWVLETPELDHRVDDREALQALAGKTATVEVVRDA